MYSYHSSSWEKHAAGMPAHSAQWDAPIPTVVLCILLCFCGCWEFLHCKERKVLFKECTIWALSKKEEDGSWLAWKCIDSISVGFIWDFRGKSVSSIAVSAKMKEGPKLRVWLSFLNLLLKGSGSHILVQVWRSTKVSLFQGGHCLPLWVYGLFRKHALPLCRTGISSGWNELF